MAYALGCHVVYHHCHQGRFVVNHLGGLVVPGRHPSFLPDPGFPVGRPVGYAFGRPQGGLAQSVGCPLGGLVVPNPPCPGRNVFPHLSVINGYAGYAVGRLQSGLVVPYPPCPGRKVFPNLSVINGYAGYAVGRLQSGLVVPNPPCPGRKVFPNLSVINGYAGYAVGRLQSGLVVPNPPCPGRKVFPNLSVINGYAGYAVGRLQSGLVVPNPPCPGRNVFPHLSVINGYAGYAVGRHDLPPPPGGFMNFPYLSVRSNSGGIGSSVFPNLSVTGCHLRFGEIVANKKNTNLASILALL